MATVGQQLKDPETGWRRYDDSDSRILYKGAGWQNDTASTGTYKGAQHYTKTLNDSIMFKFYGSKLRILANSYTNLATNIKLNIDGVDYPYSGVNSSTWTAQIFTYEKMGLSLGIHTITITSPSNDLYTCLDAIDIDDTGYLVHPTLNQVSSVLGMDVGDCIPCRYTATTSGQAGYFSELGTCIVDEIPVTGTATPNGLFYFVKTAKGTLVADRVIQTNISWDTLNAAKFIEGTMPYTLDLVPKMTSNTTPSGLAYCSSVYNNLQAYLAFDDTDINGAYFWWSAYNTGYLAYRFDSPKIVNRYSIIGCGMSGSSTPDRTPKDWQFQGSQDGNTWVTLNTQSNITWARGVKQVFTFPNSTPYLYYRINITTSNGGDVQIAEMELIGPSNYLIRSLSGGCAYADANGNKSTTDKSLGGWPTNNEWDKYIVHSDLDGKIAPGDDKIWHWNSIWSWCKETPVNDTKNYSSGALATNTNRSVRGYASMEKYAFGSGSYGFRPVLEFIESDSKQSNLWC